MGVDYGFCWTSGDWVELGVGVGAHGDGDDLAGWLVSISEVEAEMVADGDNMFA